MKYTLLELTQAILSSMDGDDVTSITDTPEATQVATVVRTAYFDLISRGDPPELYSFINLTAAGVSQPTIMSLPSTVDKVLSVKYDKHTSTATNLLMMPVPFKALDQFLVDSFMLNSDDTNVETTALSLSSTIEFLVRNDKAPDFYTTYDDNTLLFDSYDAVVDTTGLQTTKSQAYVKLSIPFTLSDGFTPDLDEPQFALLLNEAKALAWAELRQLQHVKAETNAKRGWTTLQHTKFATETISPLDRAPNYGRK